MDIYDKEHSGDCSCNPHRSEEVAKSDGIGFDIETKEFRKSEMRFKAAIVKCLEMNKASLSRRFSKIAKFDDEDEIDFSDILAAYLIWIPKVVEESLILSTSSMSRSFGKDVSPKLIEDIAKNEIAKYENHARSMVDRAESYTARMSDALVEKALSEGSSKDEFDETLDSSRLFSTSRAATIASTEMFFVANAVSEFAYKKFGMTKKRWNVYPGCCSVCSSNASQGWIPIGSAFGDGSFHPPSHPNCRCDTSVNGPAMEVPINAAASSLAQFLTSEGDGL